MHNSTLEVKEDIEDAVVEYAVVEDDIVGTIHDAQARNPMIPCLAAGNLGVGTRAAPQAQRLNSQHKMLESPNFSV